jgi:hypothetical protein
MKFTPTITASNNQGGDGSYGDTVLVTIIKGGGGRRQVCVRLGAEVMKSVRWLVGDKVLIQFGVLDDGRRAIVVNRTTGKLKGHTLSS